MRKTILIICFVSIFKPAFADMGTSVYRNALAKCDTEQQKKLKDQASTNDVNKTVMDASNCYVRVGNSVIKKYYSQTAKEDGKKFTDFANAIYSASAFAYMGPDECYPECGQISETMRMDMTESYIKKYITDMLDYIDTLDV